MNERETIKNDSHLKRDKRQGKTGYTVRFDSRK